MRKYKPKSKGNKNKGYQAFVKNIINKIKKANNSRWKSDDHQDFLKDLKTGADAFRRPCSYPPKKLLIIDPLNTLGV